MKPRRVATALIALSLTVAASAQTPDADKPLYPAYPSETPATFTATTDGHDYARREVMIPMR